MIWQYMIWEHPDGEIEHLAFHQRSLRVVYPPNNSFIRKPVATAVKFYEGQKYTLLDQGTWEGVDAYGFNKYIETVHKVCAKALQKNSETKQDETGSMLEETDE